MMISDVVKWKSLWAFTPRADLGAGTAGPQWVVVLGLSPGAWREPASPILQRHPFDAQQWRPVGVFSADSFPTGAKGLGGE